MVDGASVHATAVSIDGKGVLIRGSSGSGKSDLALRLIHGSWRMENGDVRLIADDRVLLERRPGALIAGPPAALAGLIEVRGIGIVSLPFVSDVALGLVVDLVEPRLVPRMPAEVEELQLDVHGIKLPGVLVAAFEASAPLKVLLAVRQFCR